MNLLRKLLIQLTILLILGTLYPDFVHAQGDVNSPYIPGIIPPSPNAAALMKFTDVPVSPYTGTADISVPIYTINAKGITVPVSLDYHTGGIKLKEEASWVGLGWALNAGGMISRTIMGNDDFGTQGNIYFTNQCPQLQGDVSFTQPSQFGSPLSPYMPDFYCTYQFNTSAGTEDFTPAFTTASNPYDMEPDIFSYNFPGHSGKFILTRSGAVIMQKQENIKIRFQGSGNQVTFTITDDRGNIFYFNVTEKASLYTATPISSWLLTKIVTQQRDSIMFNYSSGGSTTSEAPETYQTWGTAYCTAMNGLTTTAGPSFAYFNQTLNSIDFNNGHIRFVFDSTRNDLFGAYKLDSIMIYSRNAAGAQTYVKQDNLYYSYFNPTYAPISGNPMEYYRLKLDSVKELSAGTSQPPYSFTYNNPDPGQFTAKHSYNIDHWGYYNGSENGVLIPSMNIEYSPSVDDPFLVPQLIQFSGGNRQPDFPSMQIFSLQQITYPTGGKTMLNYQSNDYDYSNSVNGATDPLQYVQLVNMDTEIVMTSHGTISGTINLANIYPLTGNNATVNVAFRYKGNFSPLPYSNSLGIYFTLGGDSWVIDGATCTPGGVCTANLPLNLNNTVYTWSAHIDSGIDLDSIFAGIYATISYQETQQISNQQQNNYISTASGLRIQSVTNYKDANTIASEKLYNYNYLQDKSGTGNPQEYSYGRLMSIPSYARYAITTASNGGYCSNMLLFSSSINSLTSVIQGNIVGYDQVTETNVDPVSGMDIGSTVYKFFNSPDTAIPYNGWRFPGTQNIGNNLNGLLLSKTDYVDNGDTYTKVDETDNYYHTTNRSIYYSPKYQHFQDGVPSGGCASGTNVETQTLACFYPSIKSEKVLLDSTKNILYQQGDDTKAVVTTTANFYDNPAHYQVTRTRTIDSKGNSLITHIKYPQDYLPTGNSHTGNTVIDTMLGRNMVAETIEKQDTLFYSGSSTGYVTGAQLNLYRILATNSNTVVPDKIYKLDVQSPVTNFQPFSFSGNTLNMDSRYRQMVSFDQYDPYNNIQQYTSTDQDPVTIIWDYTNTYPIAQVKNAALADVAATSFEANGKGGWTFSGAPSGTGGAITGSQSYPLSSGAITKPGLTSSTKYIISGWTKGSVTLTGGTQSNLITGKTINGWTYLEITVTGTTSVTISGGAGVYIDELRMYPITAQMTTYTYSPLLGMTTSCDADNRITYYFYDGLGRLKWVKDQDGNILKTYQYHYQNLSTQY